MSDNRNINKGSDQCSFSSVQHGEVSKLSCTAFSVLILQHAIISVLRLLLWLPTIPQFRFAFFCYISNTCLAPAI